MHWRRPPRWWPLGLSVLTLAVSIWILVAWWDPITAGHPAYFIALRLVAVVSVVVAGWSVVTRRSEPAERPDRPRWRVVLVRAVSLVAVLGLVTVLLYLRPHRASSEAVAAMAGSASVDVGDSTSRIRLQPTGEASSTGVVFYPGALVDPRAYVPNLLPLAEAGFPVVILKLPFDLAVLDPKGAVAVMDADPAVERWVVAGHSLGGVAAASVAGDDDPRLQGLLLWGSFPNGSIADRTGLAVTSVYGSEDGLTTPADIERTADRLPPDTTFVEVAGGNHAFFGDYGEQGGDGAATVTRAEAQAQIRAASLELVQRVAGVPVG